LGFFCGVGREVYSDSDSVSESPITRTRSPK